MLEIIKAPSRFCMIPNRRYLFLAGSIEMGKAENWQQEIEGFLKDLDMTILNPRRDDWDSSWEQSINNSQFREQVEWELQGLEMSDFIALYFSPGTKSPITLLELGLFAKSRPGKLIVCCPDGFWRKGNVDIVCKRYGVKQVDSIQQLVDEIYLKVKK